ncbi:MAG: ribonuclease Z [Oscillospiraceae bacterium]|jgi:hypothetical protein
MKNEEINFKNLMVSGWELDIFNVLCYFEIKLFFTERTDTLILIACIDNQFGMLFNQRRQSQDRVLREKILAMTSDSKLWMDAYSAKQFSDLEAPQICVDADFLAKAVQGDYCFAECVNVAPYEIQIEKIVLYKWNRVYPADRWFPIPLQENGWRLLQTTDFAGFSHETITEEIYIK